MPVHLKERKNFANIKVASLNCRGLNDQVKRACIFDRFKHSDVDIICLQETKLKPEKEFLYRNEWDKGPSFFNSINGGKSGTAILFNTNHVIIKSSMFDKSGRIIALDVDVGGTVLHVVNTYFPNCDNDQYSFIHGLHPFFTLLFL